MFEGPALFKRSHNIHFTSISMRLLHVRAANCGCPRTISRIWLLEMVRGQSDSLYTVHATHRRESEWIKQNPAHQWVLDTGVNGPHFRLFLLFDTAIKKYDSSSSSSYIIIQMQN